jgi:hypothetical protein
MRHKHCADQSSTLVAQYPPCFLLPTPHRSTGAADAKAISIVRFRFMKSGEEMIHSCKTNDLRVREIRAVLNMPTLRTILGVEGVHSNVKLGNLCIGPGRCCSNTVAQGRSNRDRGAYGYRAIVPDISLHFRLWWIYQLIVATSLPSKFSVSLL